MEKVIPTCPKCGSPMWVNQTRRDDNGRIKYRVRWCSNKEYRHRAVEWPSPEELEQPADRLKQKGIRVRPLGPGMYKLINEALTLGEER